MGAGLPAGQTPVMDKSLVANGPGLGNTDNVCWEFSDQTAKGLGHAKSDDEQEKSCAADNGDRAAKLVQTGRVINQFQHGLSSSICLKKPYCSDFVLARTKLEQNPENLIKSLVLYIVSIAIFFKDSKFL